MNKHKLSIATALRIVAHANEYPDDFNQISYSGGGDITMILVAKNFDRSYAEAKIVIVKDNMEGVATAFINTIHNDSCLRLAKELMRNLLIADSEKAETPHDCYEMFEKANAGSDILSICGSWDGGEISKGETADSLARAIEFVAREKLDDKEEG